MTTKLILCCVLWFGAGLAVGFFAAFIVQGHIRRQVERKHDRLV